MSQKRQVVGEMTLRIRLRARQKGRTIPLKSSAYGGEGLVAVCRRQFVGRRRVNLTIPNPTQAMRTNDQQRVLWREGRSAAVVSQGRRRKRKSDWM